MFQPFKSRNLGWGRRLLSLKPAWATKWDPASVMEARHNASRLCPRRYTFAYPTPRSPSWLRQAHNVYCSGVCTRERLWTVNVLGRTGPLSEWEGTHTVCIRQSFKESSLAIVSIHPRLWEASPWETPGWRGSHLSLRKSQGSILFPTEELSLRFINTDHESNEVFKGISEDLFEGFHS